MASANPFLINALRGAAGELHKSEKYQWGHMGSCNCGFLAQEITRSSPARIHSGAMQKYGDWNDQLNDYCPTSGLLMDELITQMLDAGLTTDDLQHLEKLSDPCILKNLPEEKRFLRHNVKADVILYLECWARQLEKEWTEKQPPAEQEDVENIPYLSQEYERHSTPVF